MSFEPHVLDFVDRQVARQIEHPKTPIAPIVSGLFAVLQSPGSSAPMAVPQWAPPAEPSGGDIVAPEPHLPAFEGEEYDVMQTVKLLPALESLPWEFDPKKGYSVRRLNDQTVAMAADHYFDLITARDKCLELDVRVKQLEALLMVTGTRYQAIHSLLREFEILTIVRAGTIFCVKGTNHCDSRESETFHGTNLGDVLTEVAAKYPPGDVVPEPSMAVPYEAATACPVVDVVVDPCVPETPTVIDVDGNPF